MDVNQPTLEIMEDNGLQGIIGETIQIGPVSISIEFQNQPQARREDQWMEKSREDETGGHKGLPPNFQPKHCQVCEDYALGFNFGAITCESCKSFFRRQWQRNAELSCPFKGNCRINVNSRKHCPKCRLQKCFQVGMRKPMMDAKPEFKTRKRAHPDSDQSEDIVHIKTTDQKVHVLVKSNNASSEPNLGTELVPTAQSNQNTENTSNANINQSTSCHAESPLAGINQVSFTSSTMEADPKSRYASIIHQPTEKQFHSFSLRSSLQINPVVINDYVQSKSEQEQPPQHKQQSSTQLILHSPSTWKQEKLMELIMAKEEGWKNVSVVHTIHRTYNGEITPMDFYYVGFYIHRCVTRHHNRLTGFRQLPLNDKIALLNDRGPLLVTLRQAIMYDPKRDRADISYPGCPEMAPNTIKLISRQFYDQVMKIKYSYPDQLRSNETLMLILLAIAFYDTNCSWITSRAALYIERRAYMEILKDYLAGMLGDAHGGLMFRYLITWINCVHLKLETGVVTGIQKFDPNTLELVEFDISMPSN